MKNYSQAQSAKAFSERWQGRGDEKQETQKFWIELLHDVFGVANPTSAMEFEKKVRLEGSVRFIDVYIPDTRVIVEQKSIGIDLGKEGGQSGGDALTPYNQARRYDNNLPLNEKARWIVCCNFESFEIHDMQKPLDPPEVILLENLEKEYYRLQFLVEQGNEHLKKEMEVSLKAGVIIGKIYDEFLKQYINPEDPHTLKSLNVLCVRLVFCLYAEDAGLFGEKRCMFHDYLAQFKPGRGDMRRGLIDLFDILNTPEDKRSPYTPEDLKAFPYCNGGLFSDREIEIPFFNETLANLILKHASDDFDWSQISPTIFGAVFESTLNPETRRSGGMHYTSIENIHKVIDPLFLNELTAELEGIEAEPVEKKRIQKAKDYQGKLASLKFLDPACGSGNFLTETYLSLRRLENRAIAVIAKGSMILDLGEEYSPIKVNIHQFYGIEINDFAVATATTALWIAEAQMMMETEKLIHTSLDFLPLKSYNNIIEGNALRMDWNNLSFPDDEATTIIAGSTHLYRTPPLDGTLHEPVFRYGDINLYTDTMDFNPRETKSIHVDFDYIIGNPPFVGYSLQSKEQKADILSIYVDEKGKPYSTAGKIDYVAGWYWKASEMMASTDRVIRTALVSTNSITQGEQVAAIWKPLYERFGIHIDFAWRTFRWDSEASEKAHVHCVIIGFSNKQNDGKKCLCQSDGLKNECFNINPYLVEADNVFIETINNPLCDVPSMIVGNRPADGGNLIIEDEDYNAFIKDEPTAKKYIKRLMGSVEFINNKKRWCLWLVGVSPAELKSMPKVLERVISCREDRLASPDAGRRKLADRSAQFRETNNPEHAIVIPEVSSARREYIPIGFIGNDIICTNKLQLIPDAQPFHFGVLMSSVHMAWTRVVCGRLKSDYDYSKKVVYNNFPWPALSESQKEKIEKTAQAIVDIRALYPDCSLADLYDPNLMPYDLRKAHQANDKAVLDAYGFRKDLPESEIVAELFKMYQKLTSKN